MFIVGGYVCFRKFEMHKIYVDFADTVAFYSEISDFDEFRWIFIVFFPLRDRKTSVQWMVTVSWDPGKCFVFSSKWHSWECFVLAQKEVHC